MPDASTLFELLSSEHRRRILISLCDRETIRVPMDLITRGQTRSKQETAAGAVPKPPSERELEIRLHHVDIPKLEAHELVEWDADGQTISKGPRFERVEPSVELIVENPDRFPVDLL